MNWEQRYRDAMEAVTISPAKRAALLMLPEYRETKRRGIARTAAVVLIAAILLGALTVTAALAPADLRDWFSQRWQSLTGQPMSQEQQVVLGSLSQSVGESAVSNGVTLTVDSAVIGTDSFWLLLKVDGVTAQGQNYRFETTSLQVEPDPVHENGGLGSWGLQYLGSSPEGELLFLMDYSYHVSGENGNWPGDISVVLKAENLLQERGKRPSRMVGEGTWTVSFTLDQRALSPVKQGADCWVLAEDWDQETLARFHVRDLRASATGVRFTVADDAIHSHRWEPTAILSDGTEVPYSSGGGTPTEDDSAMVFSYQWQVPVDPEQVIAVRIGRTEIPLVS